MTNKNLFFAILISFSFVVLTSCSDTNSESSTEKDSEVTVPDAQSRAQAALDSLDARTKRFEAAQKLKAHQDSITNAATTLKMDSLQKVAHVNDSLLKLAQQPTTQTPVANTPAPRRTIAQPTDTATKVAVVDKRKRKSGENE